MILNKSVLNIDDAEKRQIEISDEEDNNQR